MDTVKRKKILSIAIAASSFIVLAGSAVILASSAVTEKYAAASEVFSQDIAAPAVICPTIISGETGLPVKNAQIVIPEADKTYITDENGSAGELIMPVNPDIRYNSILEKPWGEVTLLVYADGYTPCAICNYMVSCGVSRSGPTVMLYEKDGSESAYLLSESPDREWINALVEKYRP